MGGVLSAASNLFFKSEWNGNRELERVFWYGLLLWAAAEWNEAQFLQRLVKGASLQTADHEQLGSLNQVVFCLFKGFPLGGYIKRRAVRDEPIPFFLYLAEKYEIGLHENLH